MKGRRNKNSCLALSLSFCLYPFFTVGLFRQPASSARQRPILDSMRLFRCHAQPLLAIRLILRIVAIEPNHFAVAFECQDMGRDTIEKPAIMGNYHGAAGEILQRLL